VAVIADALFVAVVGAAPDYDVMVELF